MATLYITASEAYSGKSALCVGLGKRSQRDGYTIGYMKPIFRVAQCLGGQRVDEDAAFMKQVFGLQEPTTTLAPICVDDMALEMAMQGRGKNVLQIIETAFADVSREKDIVLLEGANGLMQGFVIGAPPYEVSRLLKARELLLVKWTGTRDIDYALAARELLGKSLLGVVVNAVPHRQMEFVKDVVTPYLNKKGIKVYGVLPQERVLRSISIRELAEAVNGEVLCCEDALDELVENLMVGAMRVDSALSHFRLKANKAVITGGDRPDIQLAALETSTKCLVLTGNLHPSPIILGRAEEMGVPMILVSKDTLTTVELAERAFYQARFHEPRKLARFEELMEENFDFEGLYTDLGLK
ncbi:MAG: phosphotransacetylase family protein [Chloroflexota bacterium]